MKKYILNQYFLIALIIIAGAGLRFYNLGFKSLWLDEAVIYWSAQGTLQEVAHHNLISNSAPPTFTFLIHYISKLGNSEFMLRLIPCIAGIVSIPVAFLLFRRIFGSIPACAASLLIAFAPSQIEYSQQLREYSMAMLATLLIVYFAYRIIIEDKRSNYFFYSIILCLSLFLQYGLSLVIASTCIVFTIEVLRRKQFKKLLPFAMSLIPVFISGLLVFNISLKDHMAGGARGAANYLQHAYWEGALSSLPAYLVFNSESVVRFSYASETKTLLMVLMLLGVYASIKHKKFYPLLLAMVMFSITIALGLFSLYPYFGGRQTIFLTVPVYLLAGMGFYYLFQNGYTKPVFYIVLAVFSVYGLMQSFEYLQEESCENVKPILNKLQSNLETSDKIYINLAAIPAIYYYLDRNAEDVEIFYEGGREKEKNLKTLDALIPQTKRLWLIFTHAGSNDQEIVLSFLRDKKDTRFQTFYESESGVQKLILATFE